MAVTDGEIHLNETVSDKSSDNEASEADYESNDGYDDGNAGWADSISKILKTNKPKNKKTLVLSKAKKLTDVKREKRKLVGFQVETAEGTVKEEEVVVKDEEDKDTKEPLKKKKRELLPKLRVKPDILEKDRERKLAKIATKGVVQLFNAVRMQQKDIARKVEEAGPLDVRKEKALKSIDKRTFLDVLMGEKSEIVDDEEDVEKVERMEFV